MFLPAHDNQCLALINKHYLNVFLKLYMYAEYSRMPKIDHLYMLTNHFTKNSPHAFCFHFHVPTSTALVNKHPMYCLKLYMQSRVECLISSSLYADQSLKWRTLPMLFAFRPCSHQHVIVKHNTHTGIALIDMYSMYCLKLYMQSIEGYSKFSSHKTLLACMLFTLALTFVPVFVKHTCS